MVSPSVMLPLLMRLSMTSVCLCVQVKKSATKKAASTGKKPAAKTPKSAAKKVTPKPKSSVKKPAVKKTPKSAAKKA